MRYFFSVVLACTIISLSAQDDVTKLPQNVNRYNTDNFLPVVTPDGKTLYYFTNYTNFGDIEVRKVERVGVKWTNPEDVNPKIFNPNLNHKGSIFFSYMVDEVYVSTRKSPVIGGFDIKMSTGAGANLGEPVNIGKPVNSSMHEGAPSLSPDGNVLYFMRCSSMDADSESDCKIFRANRKSSGLWEEPVVLPDHINSGDCRFPVILPDGETLIYSSNVEGSVGGFDLYMTRMDGESWTKPLPLDFLNTEADEMKVTAPLPGDRLYYSTGENRERQLFFSLLPKEFMAKPVRMYKGHVFDQSNNPLDAVIQAIDVTTGKTVVRTESDSKGSFQILLPSGYEYDFSIFARGGNHLYHAEFLDMLEMESAERKFVDIELQELQDRATFQLRDIIFNEDSTHFSSKSHVALNRLSYVLSQNPEFDLEVGVFLNDYREDTVSSYGLTEQDTIVMQQSTIVEVTDSIMTPESLNKVDSLLLIANEQQPINEDSLRRSVLSYRIVVGYDTLISEKEQLIFHNDRTQKLADEFKEELIDREIAVERVSAIGYREELWEGLDFGDRKGFVVAVRFREKN